MRGLAETAMRGTPFAVSLVAFLGLASAVVSPLTMLSGAIVALVTLRQGAWAGFSVTALGLGLAVALAQLLLSGDHQAFGLSLLLAWLPVWLAASLLRISRQLSLTLELLLVLGACLVILITAAVDDLSALWNPGLETLQTQLVSQGLVETDQVDPLMALLRRWIFGLLAAGTFFQLLLCLLLGRWWQSLLYYPGGFAKEFMQLYLHSWVIYAGMVVLLWVMFFAGDGADFLRNMVLLWMPLLFLVGLAVIHASVSISGMHKGWLIGLYALLLVAMPHAEWVVLTVGMLDTWVHFRKYLKGSRPDVTAN